MWASESERFPNLRFNTLHPGPMASGVRLRGYPGDLVEKMPQPASVTPKLLWLLGPDSKGVSGRSL